MRNTTTITGLRNRRVRGRGAPGGVSASAYLILDRGVRRRDDEGMPTISNGLRFVGHSLPTPRQLAGVEAAKFEAFAAQRRLQLGESIAKAPARDAQRVLRVDLQLPCERDHREEEVAKLVERLL